MYEKVSPSHPDKLCDRIANAIVDMAYCIEYNPRIAVEVLLGHGMCVVVIESSVAQQLRERKDDIVRAITRIAQIPLDVYFNIVDQDPILSQNQDGKLRCGDNGIFKGMPLTDEQKLLSQIARDIYSMYPYDGKYILDGERLIICQSHASSEELRERYPAAEINPLGDWTGGPDVDTGATNRKLGSDMADSVTGAGNCGKDLSKADVSVNIYAFLKAQETGEPVELSCAIGDEYIDGKPYSEIVERAREYIQGLGGFEKFAEWGFV